MTEKSQVKVGTILQYIQMALNILITLIYTPIMLKFLGKAEHGIYSLSSSFISYLSLLSLGFGGSYLRFYSKYRANQDDQGIKQLNGLFLIVFSIMGIICLGAGLCMTTDYFMKLIFDDGLSNEELSLARNLMLILVLNMSISFPASVFVSYVTSQEKFLFQKSLNAIKTIISPALNIPLLFLGFRSVALVLVTLIVSISVDLSNVLYCLIKLKMKFRFHDFEKGLFKNIFLFSVFIAINQIIDQINWSTDKLIITRFRGAEEVSIYSIGAQINTLYISFSTAISHVFAPRVNRIIAEKKNGWNDSLNELFVKVGRIQFYVVILVLTGFIFFGKYFIEKWAGPGYEESYIIALLLMGPETVPLIQNLGIEIQRAEDKHQFRSIIYLGVAIANVIGTIFLVQTYGAVGASVGTALSLILGNIIIMNIFYHISIKINMIGFWKAIFKIFPALIIPCVSGVLMMIFYRFYGLWDYILFIILYIVIFFLSMRFFAFNKYEISLIQNGFVRICKKSVFNKNN